MHKTEQVDDPLLRLIEWHSSAGPAHSQPLELSQADEGEADEGEADEAALLEWHTRAVPSAPESGRPAS